MYFTSVVRYSPEHDKELRYYKIKESFRDVLGRVHTRVLLTPGYLPDLTPEEIVQIRKGLTWKLEQSSLMPGIIPMFDDDPTEGFTEKARQYIDKFWTEILDKGTIDASRKSYDEAARKARKLIDVNTVKHTDAREVGAENVCLQAIRELRLEEFLQAQEWDRRKINATMASLIARTVYSSSEWKTLRLLEENSAAMELITGKFGDNPTQREVYGAPLALYALKDKLERHLCSRTDSLFNLTNSIILYDLTNFYFEGSKQSSKKAKFGRSKEKRTDCRLLVLALAINTEGFIRYSAILPGNTADPNSLPDMVERIIAKNPVVPNPEQKVLVVLDAGIATDSNLELLKSRGYNYLCVSRNRPQDCSLEADGETVTVYDSRRRPITMARVKHQEGGDWYLQVTSPSKAMTEESMNRQWKERFETELQKARNALSTKGGTKKYDKVVERVGRALGKYPSVSKFYTVSYVRSEEKPALMADIKWEMKVDWEDVESRNGVYFLRTDRPTLDEKSTWEYYNLIREIECTNRQLKTDLNLRPIYHQKDDNSDAHLFFGLLAYWIVNTIRYKLKKKGINSYWTEIVRKLSTQKAITTEGENPYGETVEMRLCSDPTESAAEIYRALGYKSMPFRKYTIKDPSPPPD